MYIVNWQVPGSGWYAREEKECRMEVVLSRSVSHGRRRSAAKLGLTQVNGQSRRAMSEQTNDSPVQKMSRNVVRGQCSSFGAAH